MEERALDSSQDLRRLQRCMNDVVSLLALPAVWGEARRDRILTTLLDAILGMLRLDFVYGRLNEHGADALAEIVKTSQSADLALNSLEVCEELRRWFEGDPEKWPTKVQTRVANQQLSVISIRLGLQGEIGVIAAGSRRVGFPDEAERLVLNIAANQAAIGLQQARLLIEQKWLSSELDRRVAQRTEELAAANEDLQRNEAALRDAHEQLRKSEERWRAVFENSAVGVALSDFDCRLIAVNPAFARMLGYTQAELVNLSFIDITENEYRDTNRLLVDELLEGKCHQFQIEKQYRRKDGGLVWARSNVSIVSGTECEPGFLVMLSEDITERKHTEGELKSSEAKHRLVLETASDVVVSMDEEGSILFANPAVKTVFGYDSSELIGKPLTLLMPESMTKMHVAGYSRYLKTGERKLNWRGTEVTALRANGDEFPVEVSFGEMQVDGRKMFTGCIRDITARHNWRLAQEELRKAQAELATMMRMVTIGHLTASIVHEINQPLFGIITNAGTCLRMLSVDPPNVEGARETARRTIRDGNLASDVIARLRTLFSKKQVVAELLDLNEATREVVDLLLNELQREHIVLRQEFDSDLPLVRGDRVQLQQVILNLLRNATEAMETVEDRPRELVITTGCEAGDKVRLSVQDNGVGMAPQTAKRLFEAFFSMKSNGMGIGLSICRSIIEAHHGHIWVTQSDTPGCTFAFSIPRDLNRVEIAEGPPTS